MKRVLHALSPMVSQVHPYPFYVFVGCLYAAIALFFMCGLVMWVPAFLTHPDQGPVLGEQLFQLGMGVLSVGATTAPIMDLILHFDGKQKQ